MEFSKNHISAACCLAHNPDISWSANHDQRLDLRYSSGKRVLEYVSEMARDRCMDALKKSCHVWNNSILRISKNSLPSPWQKAIGHACRLTFHRRLSSARLARS
jgi:hypothetical protein